MAEHVMAATSLPSRAPSCLDPTAVEPVRTAPEAGWCWLVATVAARAYLAFLLTLLAVATLPTLASWTGYVVRTGSMEPAIEAGDVVVASPFSATGGEVPDGRVMVFRNPVFGTTPSAQKVLVHRVVGVDEDGSYVTKGDQNRSNDSSPVSPGAFTGRARLLVPMVGLPVLWWDEHRWLPLALWLIGTGAAIHAMLRRPGSGVGRDRHRGIAVGRLLAVGQRIGHVVPAKRHEAGAVVLTLVMVLAIGSVPFGVVDAAFSAETRSSGNRWTAAAVLRSRYDSAILANNPYLYYRLDEASGATATDMAGGGRNGTFTAISAYQQAGAMVTNPDDAVCTAGGGGRIISGGTSLSNPTTFTLELWFRTTTTTGGKLIGFESSQASTSSKFDRHVYMNNAGRLVYGRWGSSPRTITSSASYNNGSWHLLTLTAAPNGSTQRSSLYIDGVLAVSGTTSAVASYNGWWRVGYGALASGSGYPSSANFTGCLDNVAVYPTELTSNQVAAHYAAR